MPTPKHFFASLDGAPCASCGQPYSKAEGGAYRWSAARPDEPGLLCAACDLIIAHAALRVLVALDQASPDATGVTVDRALEAIRAVVVGVQLGY